MEITRKLWRISGEINIRSLTFIAESLPCVCFRWECLIFSSCLSLRARGREKSRRRSNQSTQILILSDSTLVTFPLQQKAFYNFNGKQTVNSKYINESTVSWKCEVNSRTQPCNFSPHLTFFLLTELKRPYLHFKGIERATNRTFMEQFVDLCAVYKAGFGFMGIFVQVFMEVTKGYVNFDFKCPLKKVGSIENVWHFLSYRILFSGPLRG